MNHGHYQLELDENSQDIITFSTHIGFYRYKRLNYGAKSAGDIFQNRIKIELTQYIPGVNNISDDILVTGKDQQEHDQRLEAFLETVRVKTLLQYNARFMKKFASSTEKLRSLLKESKFRWKKEHQEALEDLKKGLCEETTLTYFDPNAEHEVHVDGCPVGISATLESMQATTPSNHGEPLTMTNLPEEPWERVSMDFVGPLSNKDMILKHKDSTITVRESSGCSIMRVRQRAMGILSLNGKEVERQQEERNTTPLLLPSYWPLQSAISGIKAAVAEIPSRRDRNHQVVNNFEMLQLMHRNRHLLSAQVINHVTQKLTRLKASVLQLE
ncbi:Hypothetical predicted protein, partial [Paramuricea clavata]